MSKFYEIPGINLGIDFSGRSPYSIKGFTGVPPARFAPPDVLFVGGQPTFKGAPLGQNNKTAQSYLINPASVPESKSNSQPSFQSQYYGDSGMFPVVLAAGIPQLVLKRPANTRVQLTIQNTIGVAVIAYNFGAAPSLTGSININAGGNRLWDNAVPQGDLWLVSNGAATVMIEFINKDLTNPN